MRLLQESAGWLARRAHRRDYTGSWAHAGLGAAIAQGLARQHRRDGLIRGLCRGKASRVGVRPKGPMGVDDQTQTSRRVGSSC
jgi:hypothetical protein